MKIIRVGPYTVLAQVEWVASQAETQKEAVSEALSQENSKKYGIVIEGLETFAVGLTEKAERATVGAAWLADSQKNDGDFVLIEPVDGDEYWMCAIKNGTPFYGSDLIGKFKSIEAEAKNILQSGGFRLITSVDKFGETLGALATQYTAAGFESTVKGKGGFKVKNLKAGNIMIMSGIALAVVAAIGWFGWSEYSDYKAQQEMVAKQKIQKAQKAQLEFKNAEEMKAQFNATKEKMVKARLDLVQSALTMQGGATASSKWVGAFSKLRASAAGWVYTDAVCEYKGCVVSLATVGGATNKDLFRLFPTASLDAKNVAEVKLPVSIDQSTTRIENLKTKAQFEIDGLSELQTLKGSGFTVEWTPPVPLTVSVPVPKPPVDPKAKPGAPGSAQTIKSKPNEIVPIGVLKGTFKIDGKNLWSAEGVSRQLKSPEMVLEKLEMSFDKSTNGLLKSWTLEGSYYAKP
jgi:hypothetical protein